MFEIQSHEAIKTHMFNNANTTIAVQKAAKLRKKDYK